MGIDFNWQTEGETTPTAPPGKGNGSLPWLAAAIFVIGLVCGGWFGVRQWLEHREDALKTDLQTLLDLERQAVQEGDGELFLALQTNDPAWIAAQLLPRNQAFNQARREVTRAKQLEGEAWANVRWPVAGASWQRIVFFRWDGSEWRRSGHSDSYWGETKRYQYDWGTLVLPESDQAWRGVISQFVMDKMPANTPNLTIILETSDGPALGYETSQRAGEVRIPSPRFWGLDNNGRPGAPFWSALQTQLNPQPTTLRFVVPDIFAFRYLGLAQSFRQDYLPPGFDIEIIPENSLPADPRAWLPLVDGARLMPTESLIAAGYVRDLTTLAQRDTQFNQGDFYEQVWRAAWWRDRMWVVPANAAMSVIYYSRDAFRQAGLAEPQVGWTWDNLRVAANQLSHPLDNGDRYWGVMDTSADLVWGFGFSWGSDCSAGPCLPRLGPEQLRAALSWYGENVGKSLPDVRELSSLERELAGLRLLTLQQVGMWVSLPVDYETQLSRMPLGVVPFPASAAQAGAIGGGVSAGITPLRVSGFIISQASAHPRLMWEWLRYLSYASPDQLRTIPARPSVATQTIFWRRLPDQLGAAMTATFPLSRPILIGEENWITWDQLQTPATPSSPRPLWFQQLNRDS